MGRMPSTIDEIEARVAAGGLERIVVDVRHKGGGDNTTYASFLRTLQEADAAGIPVYVLMGRITFSAAGNFVADVEQTTGAIFVGEELGTSPNHYGDSVSVRLEHSGLVFRVAPQHHVGSVRDDGGGPGRFLTGRGSFSGPQFAHDRCDRGRAGDPAADPRASA
jgi:hypothetical protein